MLHCINLFHYRQKPTERVILALWKMAEEEN